MPFLELNAVTMQYPGEPAPCVRELDLGVDEGEIVVLLGASGCGKTTILKVIAGIEQQNEGSVVIDGEPMDGVAPHKRPLSMVFQKALLFRNLTVEKNVNFAPRVNRTLGKTELARKTEEMLALVGMAGMGKKRATELSGGQEQRVSLARALMVEPKVLLLDEPFSALDASLRTNMQEYLRGLNERTRTTMLFVTHDQREAVSVASRIALMHDGRLVQVGKPRDFYTRPATVYAAEFFGWKNLLALEGAAAGDDPVARRSLELLDARGSIPSQGASGGGWVGIRPEAAVLGEGGPLSGTIEESVYQGPFTSCTVQCGARRLFLDLPSTKAYQVEDTLSFDLDSQAICFMAS